MDNKNKKLKLIFSGIFWTVFCLFVVMFWVNCGVTIITRLLGTVTTDISKYGTYKGHVRNDVVTEYIESFFPERIEPYFSDVVYSYFTGGLGPYGYEAYLEFTIQDKAVFEEYVRSLNPPSEWKAFRYDDRFMEAQITDCLCLDEDYLEACKGYLIDWASIGKILYCAEEQRVIFVAIGSGRSTVNTAEVSVFFDRFQIDPVEYASHTMTEEEYYAVYGDPLD